MDKLIKSQILNSLLETIYDISDAESQERCWIKRLEPTSDFGETMCHFFDDCNAENIVTHPNDFDIQPDQHAKLLEFYNVLRAYSDDTPGFTEIEVMQDPRWHKIRVLAQEVLKVFNFQKNS